MNTLGIYFHIPFCAKKCPYCDFYSVCYSKQQTELYIDAVLRNLRYYSNKNTIVDTLYFGGGTPSLLKSSQIEAILNEVCNNFALSEKAEITLEANPAVLSPEKLKELHNTGINRLSLGVQSLNDEELKFLGRLHNAERAARAVNDAVSAGFDNISCDLMIALPNQTEKTLEYSINKLTELPIQHISSYILKVENGTPFDCDDVRSILPDDDMTSDLYLMMCELLENRGFMQYEVSNYAKSGYESRHNSRYWKCQDYLGIGPAAHSCYHGKRFSVTKDIESFIQNVHQDTSVTDESPCGFEEYAMLRLRLKEGLLLEKTAEHREEIEKKLPPLVKAGYILFDGKKISLTRKGFLMSNSVIEYLIF